MQKAKHLTRLEHWRRQQKLTKEALGEMLGVSGVQAGRYCRGEQQPSRAVAKRLAEITGGIVTVANYADEVPE